MIESSKLSLSLFFKQVAQETRRITWPTRKEVSMTSVMVFVMVMVFAAFFLCVDHVIALGIRLILGIGR